MKLVTLKLFCLVYYIRLSMDVKDVLKLITTGASGLFTGGCAIIHVVDSPARMTLDTLNCRKHWVEAYYRAKTYMVRGTYIFI